jgi:hypothetical protein
MLKVRNRSVSAALNAWHDKTRGQRQRRYTLQRIMLKIQNRTTSAALNAWHDKVGWCRLTVSKPVFKAHTVSALETII